jgi:hypothetical protein
MELVLKSEGITMRKYLIKANSKVYVVIFGIMILAGLVLCVMLVHRWRDSLRSEALYETAALCAGPVQSGCRREIESVVKDTHSTSGRYKTIHYVSVSMPSSNLDGNIPVWWEKEQSLYSRLKAGDRVTAEEWEGQIVAIRDASGGTLRTEYDLTFKREGFVTSLIAVSLMMILIIFVEYKLVRRMMKVRLQS